MFRNIAYELLKYLTEVYWLDSDERHSLHHLVVSLSGLTFLR